MPSVVCGYGQGDVWQRLRGCRLGLLQAFTESRPATVSLGLADGGVNWRRLPNLGAVASIQFNGLALYLRVDWCAAWQLTLDSKVEEC
jgi:hypothetical protein